MALSRRRDIDRVAYAEFTEDWKGKHPRAVLEGFDGHIQGDGYAGIDPLFGGEGGPVRVGCNDHCRRRFVAALKSGVRDAQAPFFRWRWRRGRLAA